MARRVESAQADTAPLADPWSVRFLGFTVRLAGAPMAMPAAAMGMVAAAFGHRTPVNGALSQDVIGVEVIRNALRALRGDKDGAIKGQETGDVP